MAYQIVPLGQTAHDAVLENLGRVGDIINANFQELYAMFGTYAPTAWNGSAIDMTAYSSVTIWVTTAPTTAYTVKTSPDNVSANYDAVSPIDGTNTVRPNIPIGFTGQMNIGAPAWVRLSGGAGGVFQISAIR
jgi:hypothetical protein